MNNFELLTYNLQSLNNGRYLIIPHHSLLIAGSILKFFACPQAAEYPC